MPWLMLRSAIKEASHFAVKPFCDNEAVCNEAVVACRLDCRFKVGMMDGDGDKWTVAVVASLASRGSRGFSFPPEQGANCGENLAGVY